MYMNGWKTSEKIPLNYLWIGLNFPGWLSKPKSQSEVKAGKGAAVSIICQIV